LGRPRLSEGRTSEQLSQYKKRFSSYRAVNTCLLGYKNLSVNNIEELTTVERYTKHINTLCAQKAEFFNVKHAGSS